MALAGRPAKDKADKHIAIKFYTHPKNIEAMGGSKEVNRMMKEYLEGELKKKNKFTDR